MIGETGIEDHDLSLMHIETRSIKPCTANTEAIGDERTGIVSSDDGQRFAVTSSLDFEEALAGWLIHRRVKDEWRRRYASAKHS